MIRRARRRAGREGVPGAWTLLGADRASSRPRGARAQSPILRSSAGRRRRGGRTGSGSFATTFAPPPPRRRSRRAEGGTSPSSSARPASRGTSATSTRVKRAAGDPTPSPADSRATPADSRATPADSRATPADLTSASADSTATATDWPAAGRSNRGDVTFAPIGIELTGVAGTFGDVPCHQTRR